MKLNRLIFNVLLIFCFCSLNAQKAILPQFQAGVRAGANYANFRALQNSAIESDVNNTFIMAGGFIQARIFKKFGLRGEVLYNPKGALINYFDGNNVKVEAVRQLNYTDATLSLMYNFNVLKIFGFYAFAGYGYENLQSAKNSIQAPYTKDEDISQYFRKEAHSMLGGLGLRIRISNINLSPEIRYIHGLTDVVNTNVQTKNQVVTASLGLSFTL